MDVVNFLLLLHKMQKGSPSDLAFQTSSISHGNAWVIGQYRWSQLHSDIDDKLMSIMTIVSIVAIRIAICNC